jgi:ADP-heptose:LPS heptosyltransferase
MFFRRSIQQKNIAFCLGDGCGLGNFVQALPAVQALYEKGHTIDLFLSSTRYKAITDIVKGQPYIRNIYEDTYAYNATLYDVCIVSFLPEHCAARARKTIHLRQNWNKRSEYQQYCWAALKLGAKDFRPPALSSAQRTFSLKQPNILIHAGSSHVKMWERKRWPHYAELAERLIQDGFHMYCCGSEDEIIEHPRVTAYNSLPIRETAALILQCELFVSNDSGLMHLAAALRKKQVAIFTATNPKKSAPSYNPNSRSVLPQLRCFPCQGTGNNWQAWENCTDWQCRDAITVEHVYQVIKQARTRALI